MAETSVPRYRMGEDVNEFAGELSRALKAQSPFAATAAHEYRRAISSAPTPAARVELTVEYALAELDQYDELAAVVDSINVVGTAADEIRAIIGAQYLRPKRERVQALLRSCSKAEAQLQQGAGTSCAEVATRLAPRERAVSKVIDAAPCTVSGRLSDVQLFAGERDPRPFARLTRSLVAQVSPGRRGARAMAQLETLQEPVWVEPQRAFQLTRRLDLVPGHVWVASDVPVSAHSVEDDGTAMVEKAFGRGARPARVLQRVRCDQLRPAGTPVEDPDRSHSSALGIGVSSSVEMKAATMPLFDRPRGRLVAVVARPVSPELTYVFHAVDRDDGWIRVHGRSGFWFDGWVPAAAVKSLPSGGGGTGFGLGGLGHRPRRYRALNPLPLRLGVGQDTPVATIGKGTVYSVVEQDDVTTWISVEGLEPLNAKKLFAVPTADLGAGGEGARGGRAP